MNTTQRIGLFAFALFLLWVLPRTAVADKTSVRIEAPESAAPGTEVTVRVHITHEGNNFFHFTDGVYIRADGREIGRWTFTADNRPEADNFTREVSYTVDATTRLVAQGNCNQHGSEGPAEAIIQVASKPAAAPMAQAETVPQSSPTWRFLTLLSTTVLVLGVVNMLLLGFQMATGMRWIKVKIGVHRRNGKILLASAFVHAVLALFMKW